MECPEDIPFFVTEQKIYKSLRSEKLLQDLELSMEIQDDLVNPGNAVFPNKRLRGCYLSSHT